MGRGRDQDWMYARYYVDVADQPPTEFLYNLKSRPSAASNLAPDSDANTKKAFSDLHRHG